MDSSQTPETKAAFAALYEHQAQCLRCIRERERRGERSTLPGRLPTCPEAQELRRTYSELVEELSHVRVKVHMARAEERREIIDYLRLHGHHGMADAIDKREHNWRSAG